MDEYDLIHRASPEQLQTLVSPRAARGSARSTRSSARTASSAPPATNAAGAGAGAGAGGGGLPNLLTSMSATRALFGKVRPATPVLVVYWAPTPRAARGEGGRPLKIPALADAVFCPPDG